MSVFLKNCREVRDGGEEAGTRDEEEPKDKTSFGYWQLTTFFWRLLRTCHISGYGIGGLVAWRMLAVLQSPIW